MATELAEHLGGAVREFRLRRGWTQDDLADLLNEANGTWSRAKVGLLETEGIRAERLSDLALLCRVLDVGLDDLLAGDAEVEIGRGTRSLEWVRESLSSTARPQAEAADSRIDPRRIGAPSRRYSIYLAHKSGLGSDEIDTQFRALFGNADPATVRDSIAQISPEMPRRTAQAKRGQATRKLLQLLASDSDEERSSLRSLWALGPDGEGPDGHD